MMSWSLRKKKEDIFCTVFFFPPRRKCFLTFVFYLNVLYVEYAFRIYIPLHIKKHYFIHFCCLFLKLSNAFSVSLSLLYFGKCSTELAQLAPLPYSRGRSTRYSDRLHDFSVPIPRYYKDVYVNTLFLCFPAQLGFGIFYRMFSVGL